MDNVFITAAALSDSQAIAALMTELGYPTSAVEMVARLTAILQHGDYKTLVAIADNKVVGMAGLMKGTYYEKEGAYMRIVAFIVKQSYRKQGIGKLLIGAAEDWAKEQGLHTALLTSRAIDERIDAYAFYKRAGYEIRSSGFVKLL